MRHFPFYILLFFSWGLSLGQVDTLTPKSTYAFPDIHPDTLYSFIEKASRYDSLVQHDISYGDATPEEQKLIENEALYERGPFYTGAWGCSWYCVNKPITIQANQVLKSTKIEDYIPENTHDFDLRTAWVVDYKKNDANPEITFELELGADTQQLNIVIYNGFSKSLDNWLQYRRVKTMEVMINDSAIFYFNLEDHYFGQVFSLPYQKIGINNKSKIQFTITDTYGDKKKPLAVSEINFDGASVH